MNKFTDTPVNGTTLTLIADGGEYGELVPCPKCENKDRARAKRCRNCAGDGELHKAWHPVGDACRWVLQAANTPDDSGWLIPPGSTEIEVPLKGGRAWQILALTISAAVIAALIALLSASVFRAVLWIIGAEV